MFRKFAIQHRDLCVKCAQLRCQTAARLKNNVPVTEVTRPKKVLLSKVAQPNILPISKEIQSKTLSLPEEAQSKNSSLKKEEQPKNDLPSKEAQSKKTTNAVKKYKAVSKPLVVRRSKEQRRGFDLETKQNALALIRGLQSLQTEWSISAAQKAEAASVVIQLSRKLKLKPDPDAVPSEADLEMASFFMRKVHNFNDDLASYIDITAFKGKSLVELGYYLEGVREDFANWILRKGYMICSVPLVYNTLIRAFAKEGRSHDALKFLSWMDQDGLKPDFHTYTAILESMGHPKSLTKFQIEANLVQRMRSEGHAVEDLLIQEDLDHTALRNVLRVISRVDPTFKLKPKIVDVEAQRYKHFPVLQRYLKSEKSRVNPLYGVGTNKELSDGFREQLKAEKQGTADVEPITKMKLSVTEEKKQILRQKLLVEQEAWRGILTFAVENLLRRVKGNNKFLAFPYLSLVSTETIVELMMEEIDFLISESVTQFVHSHISHRRLGEGLFQAYQKKRREMDDQSQKLSNIYAEYLPKTFCHVERNPDTTNIADTWEKMCKPHLKGNSLSLKLPEWNGNTCLRVGYIMHSIMYTHLKFDVKVFNAASKREEAPLIYESLEQKGSKLQKFIKIHPVALRWFTQADMLTLRFPITQLPMLCPPIPWVSPERQSVANFLFTRDYASKLVRDNTMSYRGPLGARHLEYLARREYSPVLDALNVLSAVAWRVNRPVLDTMSKIFSDGGDRQLLRRLSLPSPVHLMTDLPAPPDQNLPYAERKLAMDALRTAHKERNEAISLWYTELYRLSIANKFRNKTFWLPHSMDFRGRVYPSPPHFNYMGSDKSRSLLKFAKGRPLGPNGLDWLLIHLVNLTGLKKRASNSERLSFANSVLDDVLDSAERPLAGRGWWMQEEDPWQVLACCLEISAALKSPDHRYYISHFPVHQDGSCNGLQHYAAMGRDQLGAECVNLTPRKYPQDVYADVVELVEQRRASDAAAGNALARQLEGYVLRKVIKQSVMTTVYGVTMYGAKLQIGRQLREFDEFPSDLVVPASGYLAELTLDSIGKIFTSSVKIQDWLVASARAISARRKVCVGWRTPLGFPVVQPYMKDLQSNSWPSSISVPDTSKQGRAFPPNYVHSLDSTHMMLTALQCYRAGISFSAVHDCYWTHAADVETMNAICREQFVALHEQPLLQDLSTSFLKDFAFEEKEMEALKGAKLDDALACNRTFKEVPSRGTLNIKQVLKSDYFFS